MVIHSTAESEYEIFLKYILDYILNNYDFSLIHNEDNSCNYLKIIGIFKIDFEHIMNEIFSKYIGCSEVYSNYQKSDVITRFEKYCLNKI